MEQFLNSNESVFMQVLLVLPPISIYIILALPDLRFGVILGDVTGPIWTQQGLPFTKFPFLEFLIFNCPMFIIYTILPRKCTSFIQENCSQQLRLFFCVDGKRYSNYIYILNVSIYDLYISNIFIMTRH